MVNLLTTVVVVAAMACAGASAATLDLRQLERERVIPAADKFLSEQPVTVTASRNPRSAGGIHDFSSEGDYWWPDPKNPDGPYIQRDGETNPENFVEHPHAMVRMSIQVGTLTSAWKLTNDDKYAQHAIKHLKAWFVDDATKMNPNLQYAQSIKNVTPGRGIGIIDTVHLIEPARAAQLMEKAGVLKGDDLAAIKKWFADYVEWMTTSKPGNDEMNAGNNHATCWLDQCAAFASFAGNDEWVENCRKRWKEILLPKHMAPDG